jgi:hypothetical protein
MNEGRLLSTLSSLSAAAKELQLTAMRTRVGVVVVSDEGGDLERQRAAVCTVHRNHDPPGGFSSRFDPPFLLPPLPGRLCVLCVLASKCKSSD